MRNTLLRMLSALMCAWAACAEVTPVKDFDLQKMAGKWYMVGFATNAPWFVNHKDSMKMGTALITPTEGGDMDLSYSNLRDDGTCWRMTRASLMLCMTTMLWSTQSRRRTECLRSSTNC